MRSKNLKQAGLSDPDFYGEEDIELSNRLKTNGNLMVDLDPKSIMRCHIL